MNKEAYALIEENAATPETRFDAVSISLILWGEYAKIYEAIQAGPSKEVL